MNLGFRVEGCRKLTTNSGYRVWACMNLIMKFMALHMGSFVNYGPVLGSPPYSTAAY